ncbi:MAG: WD40 repeat domain-containing protein [Bacteroidetes bacterium]|nr:WD40 repeat domain-containing protein [Bacteroidota bacterium]
MKEKAEVTKIHEYLGHTQSVYALAPAHLPGHFLSAGGDGIVAQWALDRPDVAVGLLRAPLPLYSLECLPAGHLVLAGQNDGGLHALDLATGSLRKSIRVHQRPIFGLQVLPGDAYFLACSEDGQLSVWDCATISCQTTAQISQASLRTVVMHPRGKEFAIAGSDGYVRVYALDGFRQLYSWQAHANTVFTLCYSPDGELLLSGSRDAHLKSWDARHGYSLVQDVPAHLFAVNDMTFSPDGVHLATASMDKTIKLWDPYTLTLIKVIDRPRNGCHLTGVNRLLWLPGGELLSCSDDRTIMQWQVRFYKA